MKIKNLAIIFLIVFSLMIIWNFIARPYLIIGHSMSPTLKDGWIYIGNKFVYHFRKPKKGEIIVARSNEDPPVYIVKRVIAEEGEYLEIKKGIVYINNQLLYEPYTIINPTWHLRKLKIKDGCVYVLGDNRGVNINDTIHTHVAYRNIIARLIVW